MRSEIEQELERLALNIARAEQFIVERISFWTSLKMDSDDDPEIIEQQNQIDSWKNELCTIQAAQAHAESTKGATRETSELATARKKLEQRRPLKCKDVMLLTGLGKSKIYNDFKKIGEAHGIFDPDFVAQWLTRDQDSAE